MKSELPPPVAQRSLPVFPVVRVAPGRGGAWRKAAQTAVYTLIVVMVCKTWFLEGLFQPLVVPGGSMAEKLLGTHRTVVCGQCVFCFPADSDVLPVSRRAVCPNCGFAENDLKKLCDASGDRVLIHKSVFFFRRPRPWEVVAFRDPGRAERVAVKRVVGLPGEKISLRRGDVYADGKIRRKPLWLQRAMAVLVHDADYSSGSRDGQEVFLENKESVQEENDGNAVNSFWVADHWIGAAAAAWGYADGRFAHPPGSQTGSADWMTFCPGRPQANETNAKQKNPDKWISEPVTDLCGYNQTSPRRIEDIHVVDDLMLSLRVLKIVGEGEMFIRARDRQSEFLVGFTFDWQNEDAAAGAQSVEVAVEAWRDGRPLAGPGRRSLKLPHGFPAEGILLEVSLFDSCLLVGVDSQEIIDYPYDPPAAATTTAQGCKQPLAIGSDGLGLVLHGVRVYRDVYYAYASQSPGSSTNWGSVTLGPDEYYVLGDNSPISVDSRNWGSSPGISHKLLLGKPLVVHWPSRIVNVGGRDFQVPDIGRIRYIR